MKSGTKDNRWKSLVLKLSLFFFLLFTANQIKTGGDFNGKTILVPLEHTESLFKGESKSEQIYWVCLMQRLIALRNRRPQLWSDHSQEALSSEAWTMWSSCWVEVSSCTWRWAEARPHRSTCAAGCLDTVCQSSGEKVTQMSCVQLLAPLNVKDQVF